MDVYIHIYIYVYGYMYIYGYIYMCIYGPPPPKIYTRLRVWGGGASIGIYTASINLDSDSASFIGFLVRVL